MKRLAVFLFVLVILAAVIFYFGWIQIRLDEDSYGVVFTKTHGWEESVIPPGEFSWRWQRLIPTNLTLHIFPVTPHSVAASLRGTLPSATTYATLLDAANPFSYSVSVNITYRLVPEALPELARDEGLRSESLQAYYGRTDNEIEQIVTETALSQLASGSVSTVVSISQTLSATLTRHFPNLDIVSVSPTQLQIPDSELYLEAKERYLSVLDARSEAMQAAAEAMAADQSTNDLELARLERYGEILERYPILLEYFRLAGNLEFDAAEFESLVLPTSP